MRLVFVAALVVLAASCVAASSEEEVIFKPVFNIDDVVIPEWAALVNLTGVPNDRACVVKAAWALYNERANEKYTQGSARWSGIDKKIYPPHAPPYSDCSSAATWTYWTCYGSGKDILNGQNWKAGYTGTLCDHGKVVSTSKLNPGDLVFYGSPTVSHVAIYVGDGKVVSHGSDPVIHASVNYRKDLNHARTYL